MRYLYTLLLYLLVPLVLLRLVWKGLRNRGYWKRWRERFGFFPAPAQKETIWIHAVSVGEFQAIIPFIKLLQQRFPAYRLAISTTTPTGSSRVMSTFGDQVFHVYLPYDLPGAVSRFLDKISPAIAIIMETEIWPNLFHQCQRRKIPVIIANARLSPSSLEGYKRVAWLIKPALARVSRIATQSEGDAQRFREIGAVPEKIQLLGNIKFDLELAADLADKSRELRQHLGAERLVWIAASTHEGEEAQILEAFRQIRQAIPQCLLVLVPRHPERFNHVATLCSRRGFNCVRRSQHQPCNSDIDVYLGDTLGEMMLMYGASDLAFVGGSLVPVGGHNMLEAAALELPVVAGPYLFNFAEISQTLLRNQAMKKVETTAELVKTIIQLAEDTNLRRQMGANGKRIIEENRGAMARLLDLVKKYLGSE